MKIKLSEIENYEIIFPERIDKDGFLGLLLRLNAIGKIFSKDNATELTSKKERTEINAKVGIKKSMNKETIKLLKEHREIVVEIYKAYYSWNKMLLNDVVAKYNLQKLIPSRDIVGGGTLLKLRYLHNIQPQEVGLVKYAKKGEKLQRLP